MFKNKLVVFFGSIMALSLFIPINSSNTVCVQKTNIASNLPNTKNNLNEEHIIWENGGQADVVSWNSICRFGLVGRGQSCIATFPQDIWDIIKGETFYANFEPENDDFIFKVTNGWWDRNWKGKEVFDKTDCTKNSDGSYTLEINLSGDPLANDIDEKDLLFTGGVYVLKRLYYVTKDPTPTPTPTPVIQYNINNNNKVSDKEQNHGYLDINKTKSVSNEICTITVNPLRGYALKEGSLKVVNSTDPTKTYDVTLPDADIEWVYTFVMPENDVIVSAEFIESAVPVPPSSGSNLSGGAIAGIVVGSLIGVGLIALLIVILLKKKKKEVTE